MKQNMVNIVELAHVIELLDRHAALPVVDRALRSAGLDRAMLADGTGFIPYAAEAIVIEAVARATGERHLGALLGRDFCYSAYGAYASYVLGAPDLATALDRGRRALILTHPGSRIMLKETRTHMVVGRDSRKLSVVGHRHLDEGALFVISHVVRHFLGPEWRPDWVEMPKATGFDDGRLAELIDAPIRTGRFVPAVAIRLADLSTSNPRPDALQDTISLDDLASLMNIEPVQSVEQAVTQVLQLRLPTGMASESEVARHLAIGPRTLQRALRAEDTSFREVRFRFIESQARKLLGNTDIPIEEISRLLGYANSKSLRRAFRKWTGQSPSSFRASYSMR